MNLTTPLRFAELLADGPHAPRVSGWITLTQQDIGDFGRLTRDPDPNHIDPEYARAHSPFGGPIAFGFQTLAMLTHLAYSAGLIPSDATHLVNYGFDRVRFVGPVHAGAQIRARFTIAEVQRRSAQALRLRFAVEVEVQGSAKPALLADWLALMEGPAA